MFKSVPGSKQRGMSVDDGGQPGSASWISLRSESMLRIILTADISLVAKFQEVNAFCLVVLLSFVSTFANH